VDAAGCHLVIPAKAGIPLRFRRGMTPAISVILQLHNRTDVLRRAIPS
jgi:hypothetical protein